MRLRFIYNDMFGFCFKILYSSLIPHPNPHTIRPPSPPQKKNKIKPQGATEMEEGRIRIGHELITVGIKWVYGERGKYFKILSTLVYVCTFLQ